MAPLTSLWNLQMRVSLAHMLISPVNASFQARAVPQLRAQAEPSDGCDGVLTPSCHTDLLQSPVSPNRGVTCPELGEQAPEKGTTLNGRASSGLSSLHQTTQFN